MDDKWVDGYVFGGGKQAKNRLAAPEAVAASAQAAEGEGQQGQQGQQGVKVPAPSPAASPLKPPAQAAA